MYKFQDRVNAWMLHTLPASIMDVNERGKRFCEEALELVQSIGLTRAEVLELVDYVYGRPVGRIEEEVGGVGVTLSSLCNIHNIDFELCFDHELDYKCWPNSDAIRLKYKNGGDSSGDLPE